MIALKVLLIGLVAITASEVNGQTGIGVATRYWDCCKPSCAWRENINNLLFGPVQTCDTTGSIADPTTESGCNGGNSYMCARHQPRILNANTAIGFVSARIPGLALGDMCCSCFKLTFPSVSLLTQKTMYVQVTNTGDDLEPGQFNIQIPGGGYGLNNGCLNQFRSVVNSWSDRIHSFYDCANMPSILQPGCQFRFNWLMGADNPAVVFQRIPCPGLLTSISGCKRSDDTILG